MISKKIDKNIEIIKKRFEEDDNLIYRELQLKEKRAVLIYFSNLTNSKEIAEGIIAPLKENEINSINDAKQSINEGEIVEIDSIEMAVQKILVGSVIIFVDGINSALGVVVKDWQVRALAEPPTSAVLKGPREGFNESIKTNVTLIRRRINTEKLAIKMLNVGAYSNTKVAVAYIDGVADKFIVKKIIQRIKDIKIDGVVDSYYILQFLEEKKNCVFKQIGSAEKPDIISAKLLEGRIAIIVDGSPIVLTIPFMLFEDVQSSDDYYSKSFRAVFVRFLRVFAVIIAVILPGSYVAVQLYHYRVIPLKFLISIVNSTQGLPMTPFVETVFVIILFEILYEASLRMPRYLGMALSIVGALILGDTAVKAGLISPPSVMIVALSGITFYTIPEESNQLSLFRLMFTFLGGTMGMFGILAGLMFVVASLCDMDTYGTPYLAPFAPFIGKDQKDFLLKQQLSNMKRRPKSLPNTNPIRQEVKWKWTKKHLAQGS